MEGVRRIAVVGPMPPIRSGIARHTSAVARAIADRPGHVVRVWGFRRQYPPLLFPGAGERLEGVGAPADLDLRETLDGVGPLSWHRTAREILDWGPDLAVLPAWTFFLAPALGHVAKRLGAAGVPVAMIVHNAFDHEAAAWKAQLNLWQLARADRFVTHNAALAATLTDRLPGRPVAVFPHPVFDDLPEPQGRLPREAALELLFFGLVRPYKGLDIALEAMARLGGRDVRLTVAGEIWGGEGDTRTLIDRLGIADRVELRAGYATDRDAAELFARADAVVLPYRSATGSGVIPTAYRYARPVIASDLPGLAPVVREGETVWLTPPGDVGALAEILARLDRDTTRRAGEAARDFGRTLSWDRFADEVLGETLPLDGNG